MEREKVNKIINISLKVLFSLLFILMFISVIRIEATKKSPEEIAQILEQQKEDLAKLAAGKPLNENIPDPWPAHMNKPYPEISLIDHDGKTFKLSDYKGKVIVLSFLDMSSPKSQAQAGSGLSGAYGVTKDVDDMAEPFDAVLRDAGNKIDVFNGGMEDEVSLPNDKVIEIMVLVYGQEGGQATIDDAENWASHFDLEKEQGIIVAIPQKDIRGKESDQVINGFQLVDANQMLRVDSSGPAPKHNLRMTLIPLFSKLLR